MANMKVMLIDGLNVIRRVYEALPGGDDARVVQHTVDGSMGLIRKMLSQVRPTHVVCVFESGAPTWRHELYPDYKANRGATPQAVRASVTQLERFLGGLGVKAVTVEGFEADDVIATIAHGLDARGATVIIASTDQGYAQLLSEHVLIYHYASGSYRDAAWVEDKFGVAPCQVGALRALSGNSSDNLRGLPGVGPKKAAALLNQFQSIDGMLQHGEDIPGKLGETLRRQGAELPRLVRLASLKTDVRVGMNLREAALAGDFYQRLREWTAD
jgi:DNA polymerase-1